MIATALIGITLFAATNVDDLFILVGFFADPKYRFSSVVIGQYLGIGALVGVSIIAALIALVIPVAFVGLLGLAPIAIGLKKLFDLRRGADGGEDAIHEHAGFIGQVATVAAVTIASGGDNIGVYTPLFAVRPAFEVGLILVVFALMTAIWCIVAHWLVNHRSIGAPIRKYGHIITPIVLIGIGVMVLAEAGTIRLLGW